jgi:hypothetical protein
MEGPKELMGENDFRFFLFAFSSSIKWKFEVEVEDAISNGMKSPANLLGADCRRELESRILVFVFTLEEFRKLNFAFGVAITFAGVCGACSIGSVATIFIDLPPFLFWLTLPQARHVLTISFLHFSDLRLGSVVDVS